MKFWMALMIAASALYTGGCNSPEWPMERRNTMNAWTIDQYHRDSERAAIVSQHTLYPYHFVANSAALNELGVRDLTVLADHYRENPGAMNVRRAGANSDLYKARLDTVTAMLSEKGVDTERIRVSDGPAGGEGISSGRMLVILEEKMDDPLSLESNELTTRRNSSD